jgi:competence ComEA-like helix-hairpin-helix protein
MNASSTSPIIDGPGRGRRRALAGIALWLLVANAAILAARPQEHGQIPVSRSDLRLRLNPNTATPAELQLLPRIGPKLAENIVAFRDSQTDRPAFGTAEDLDRVKRIGPVTVELLRPHLIFPASPERPPTEPTSP